MAAQTNNLLLLDSDGTTRTIDATNDTIEVGANVKLVSGADLTVTGNLIVEGVTQTVTSEVVLVTDNHLHLNFGYTTDAAQTGGLVVNYDPTTTTTTVDGSFTAGVAATSNPTVVTTGSGTFSAGDLIQISGANTPDNNGLFEVQSHSGTTLTIRGVGTSAATVDFVQTQFVADATVAGSIYKVNVSVLRAGTDGVWETWAGSTTSGISFTDLSSASGSTTLQSAYSNDVDGSDATITTDSTDGAIVIAGSEKLQITATSGLDLDTIFDFDGTSFDVLMTGTNGFSIDGTAASNVSVTAGNLTLSTITSGALALTSAGAINASGTTIDIQGSGALTIDSSGGAISIGSDADAQNINLGTGAAARTLNIGNATGATTLNVDAGTGGITIDTTAGGAISIDAIGATSNFTLTSNGAGQDFTLSLAGATDSSLVLSSTGTGGDALQITASAGGIDVTVKASDTSALTIADGSNTYITVDSSEVAVEIGKFANLVAGGGVHLTAGQALAAGELVAIEDTSGDAILADANAVNDDHRFVIGVSTGTFSDTATARIYTIPGSKVPMKFGSAPAGSANGSRVYLSETPGEATLTAPAGTGTTVFQVGILHNADGASTTPNVIFLPQFIAKKP